MIKCDKCEKLLEESNFKKYSKKVDNSWYHKICRECENQILYDDNWKDGLLKCHICNQFLLEENFQLELNKYNYRNNRDKRCKKCKLEQNKNARLNYTDSQKFDKVFLNRIHGIYQRSKDKNLECNVDLDYIKFLCNFQEGKCAISNIPMTYTLDEGRIYSNVSIDKINPKEGYIKGNIQLICMSVNQLKSDFDMDTVYTICQNILNNKKITNENSNPKRN